MPWVRMQTRILWIPPVSILFHHFSRDARGTSKKCPSKSVLFEWMRSAFSGAHFLSRASASQVGEGYLFAEGQTGCRPSICKLTRSGQGKTMSRETIVKWYGHFRNTWTEAYIQGNLSIKLSCKLWALYRVVFSRMLILFLSCSIFLTKVDVHHISFHFGIG